MHNATFKLVVIEVEKDERAQRGQAVNAGDGVVLQVQQLDPGLAFDNRAGLACQLGSSCY